MRTIATSGLVSATARAATAEAFHVLRIGGKVGRRARLALDAADQAVPFEQVKYGNARGLAWLPGGCFRLYPGLGLLELVELMAEGGDLLGRQAGQAAQELVEFALGHGGILQKWLLRLILEDFGRQSSGMSRPAPAAAYLGFQLQIKQRRRVRQLAQHLLPLQFLVIRQLGAKIVFEVIADLDLLALNFLEVAGFLCLFEQRLILMAPA